MPPPAEPLRARLRIAGVFLAIAVAIPVETRHDGARWIGKLAPDLGGASLVALLAPALCGALLLAATFAWRRATALAIVALATIAGLPLVLATGREALAADLLSPQAPWSTGPLPSLVAIACVVAGVCHADARRGRALLFAALASAAAHLVLPGEEEAPLLLVARVLGHVASASGPRNFLGACVLVALVLWPAIAAAAGFVHTSEPASQPRSWNACLAAYGVPALLQPLAQRWLADPWSEGAGIAGTLGALAQLAAVLLAAASAISYLADQESKVLGAERRTALAAIGAMTLAVTGALLLARPPRSAPDWRLAPATPEGDRVFGALFSAWNDGRRDAGSTLVAEARRLDAGLGDALGALVAATARGDLLERRWYRLVDRVNEASRRAALPYYVDPTGLVVSEGHARSYRIDTYRIERVRRFTSPGRSTTTLHVRALSPERPRPAALGLSRDVQPFAVVALDELRAYQNDLEKLAARMPPRCAEGPAESEAADEALRACGEALKSVAQRGELGAALLDATERHEIQHQLDGASPPRSAWLGRKLAFFDRDSRERIQRELSAYLAQMTAAGAAPRVTLLRLLRMALLVRRGVEHDVARIALAALDERGRSAAEAYQALAALDDDALRARAARAWREVLGREIATVSVDSGSGW
jgi:hypothetical protein